MSLEKRTLPANKVTRPAGIEVPWGQWRVGTRSDILFTLEIEECIAVGVHDSVTGIGHMAHVRASLESQDEILPEFSESVLETCDHDTDRLTICPVGGMGHDESTMLLVAAMERRQRLVSILQESGIHGQWLFGWNDNDHFYPHNLELHCATGSFYLTEVTPNAWQPPEVGATR